MPNDSRCPSLWSWPRGSWSMKMEEVIDAMNGDDNDNDKKKKMVIRYDGSKLG